MHLQVFTFSLVFAGCLSYRHLSRGLCRLSLKSRHLNAQTYFYGDEDGKILEKFSEDDDDDEFYDNQDGEVIYPRSKLTRNE